MAKKQPITQKYTVGDAVAEAFSALEELGGEMRERYDNTPESLQQSGVSQRVEEAADALEGLSEPRVDDAVGSIEFEYSYYPSKRSSRAARRDEATSLLHAAMDALDNVEGDKAEAANSVRVDIDDLIQEAEAVEFPGMYG